MNGSGSSVCKSLNHVRSIYNINGHREHAIQISSIKDMFDFDEQNKINVKNIKCLLDMRYTCNICLFPSNNCFTTGNLNTLFEFFCVKTVKFNICMSLCVYVYIYIHCFSFSLEFIVFVFFCHFLCYLNCLHALYMINK